MPIKFTIRLNRTKNPSVQIYKLDNKKEDDRIKQSHTSLGVLSDLTPNAVEAFAEKKGLDDYEQYTLENYAEQIRLNQQELNNPQLEDFHREMLYLPKPYETALFQLWQLAKKNNISFCPAAIMQNALLNKAKLLEKKLNHILQSPVDVLSKAGISLEDEREEEAKQQQRKTCRKLFRLLLNTQQSHEKIASDFNQIAHEHYQKNDIIKAHYLEDYATNVRKLPYWYSTVAIDLLVKYGKNPLDKISIEALVENWLRLRKHQMDENKAFVLLKDIFSIDGDKEPILRMVIQKDYEKGNPI